MVEPLQAVVVFSSRHRAECRQRALVLHAMGIDHRVRLIGREWSLLVREDQAAAAVDQIDQYVRENRDWPEGEVALPSHRVGVGGVAAYALVLFAVAAAKHEAVLGRDWFDAGRMHAGAIRDGEWWRTLTALTLHLDGEHLISNVLFGAAFGIVTGHLLGSGLAWFSILVGGALGNGLNALVQPATHTAAGASTAVFAALGLTAAYVWRRRHDFKRRWALRWAPVIGGVVMLAFTGSGGERTDIVAHLTGFIAGIGMGAYYGGLGSGLVLGRRSQWLLGAATLALLTVAWAIALGSHGSGASP